MCLALLIPMLLLQPRLSDEDPPRPPFEELGAERLPSGLVTTCGRPEKDYILEVNGGGLALADFDRDGDHDLLVVDGSTLERVAAGEPGLPPRLFLNDGDARFQAAGEPWHVAGGRWGMGAASADVDGDGYPDLFVTEWGPDRLIHNQAGAGFAEVEDSGLRGRRWGTSAAFLDADRDGFLDLAVANYLAFDPDAIASRTSGECRWKGHAVMCGPEGLTPIHDQLYRNRGDGTFQDVSVAAGLRPRRAAFGLGVMTLDFDVDGDTDLYVTNDSTPNHLWENDGEGSFAEVGLRRGVALDGNGKEQAGMGIACGDLNADGKPDLFVTNFSGESNALYLSSSRSARWRERSGPSGVGGPSMRRLGWGTALEDFDLDADLDLCVFNGHVYPEADRPGSDSSYPQLDLFHRNGARGDFDFEPLSDGERGVSRAAAAADLDGDGAPDLVALDLDGPVRLLLNQIRKAGGNGHWLTVRLRGAGANRDGLGARVQIRWRDQERTREIRTAGGFQSSVPPEAHFGLGALDPGERLERVVVHWPSGRRSLLEDVACDRVLVVEEPPAEPESGKGR